MAFLVRELPSAKDQLAALWLAADSPGRRAITAASHRIIMALSRADAGPVGVPNPIGRLPTARRIDDGPLAAIFVVFPHRRDVLVMDYLSSTAP
ncbi:MAG TPA: hypothetical protein VH120_11515 [Gemmataceae bacterium]|nr:hypothetical protein [Gemmataceae bacterium]